MARPLPPLPNSLQIVGDVLQLVCHYHMLLQTQYSYSNIFLNRFVTIMCYYGLTSAAATLSSDVYSNFQYALVVEVRLCQNQKNH